jgi:hypothetical protein
MAAKSAALEIRPEAVEQPVSAEELAERRERVDRILRAVTAEPDAGFRAIGVLYQEFVVRCRIEGLGSAVPDLGDFRLTRARAGLGSDMAEDGAWQDVSVRASILPEELQGVFMMIARAAKEGWPCPSDAAIARAYGSHSLRRAQRRIMIRPTSFFASQGSNRRYHPRDIEFMLHAAHAPMKLVYTRSAYRSREVALAGLLFSRRSVAQVPGGS